MNFEQCVIGAGSASSTRRIAMLSTHGYVATAPPLGAADTGGQVVYVLELAKKLAQLGCEVDVWTRQFEDQAPLEQVERRVRVLRAPCGGSKFIPKEYLYRHLQEWAQNALHRIEQEQLEYDILVSHYWDAGVAAGYLQTALQIPHVHTPHSLGLWKQRQMETDYPHGAESFERKYNFGERSRCERQIFGEADLVIATSPDQIDLLLGAYAVGRDKLELIPAGYDDTRFFPVGDSTREVLRQRFGFEGKVILSLGRLARNKGYDLLIRGFAEVAARDAQVRLHLAIGGEKLAPEEAQILMSCKALAQDLSLSSRITFAGFVPDEDLADLYRAADVFVLCSRYEPFGMTAVEAMACGTPTVVTVHGGLYRTLRFGLNGLYADPFDPADLGITILKALRHPMLSQRLSRRGAEMARRTFTWTGVAQQLLRVTAEHDVTRRPADLVRDTTPAVTE